MSSHATYCILGYHCNEVVNVDELKHNVCVLVGESERGTKIASATIGPIISETTLVQLG